MADILTEFELKLKELKDLAHKEGKKSVFCFASTKNISTQNYYYTSFRISKIAVSICLMIKDVSTIEDILERLDGKVDFVAYDAEIKFLEVESLPILIKQKLKKTPVLSFLGNKMTSSAVVSFLQARLALSKELLSKKKVLIYGAGHLGGKIALDLIDHGCDIKICRRDFNKAREIVSAVNILKAPFSSGSIQAIMANEANSFSYDILLACSNEPSSIGLDIVKVSSKNSILIDVGLGNFSEEALSYLFSEKRLVFVANIQSSFNSMVDHLLQDYKSYSGEMRAFIDEVEVYKSGVLSPKGAVVVDNLSDIQVVYGVSAGNGLLLKGAEEEAYSKELQLVRSKIQR
ncbi:MAG: hypothetical protein AB7I27_06125 [Bacteriovoracaceae bacterium]